MTNGRRGGKRLLEGLMGVRLGGQGQWGQNSEAPLNIKRRTLDLNGLAKSLGHWLYGGELL